MPHTHVQAYQGGGGGEEAMSAEQLDLLREYLRAQEEQEAMLQAQVENLKREVSAGGWLVKMCVRCWAVGQEAQAEGNRQREVGAGGQGVPTDGCWARVRKRTQNLNREAGSAGCSVVGWLGVTRHQMHGISSRQWRRA